MQEFEEETPKTRTSLGGFSTAGGNKLQVSEASKNKAASFMQEFEEEIPTSKASSGGFSTAGGNKLQVSEASKNKAAAFMQEFEEEIPKPKAPSGGFSTAGGNKLQVSESAKNKAASFMQEFEEEEIPKPKAPSGGFSTAGGNKLQVSEASKNKAASFMQEFEEETPQVRGSSGGFSTAGGNTLKASESAKNKASSFMQEFMEDEQDDSYFATFPDPYKDQRRGSSGGFSTGRGAGLKITNEQQEKGNSFMKSLLEEMNESKASKRSRPPSLKINETQEKKKHCTTSPTQTSQDNNNNSINIKSTPRIIRRKPTKPNFKAPRKSTTSASQQLANNNNNNNKPNHSISQNQKQSNPNNNNNSTLNKQKEMEKIPKTSIFDLTITPNRVPLSDLTTPKLKSRMELTNHGIPQSIIELNYDNAKYYLFTGISEPINDELKPNTNQEIGCKEMQKSLIEITKNPNYITNQWIENHYSLILCKLASMERCYPDNFAGTYVTPDRVFQQLKYRYEKEYNQGMRSSIRKILEKDTFASRKIILYFCKIIDEGSDPFLNYLPDDPPFRPAEILLSDGWYTLPTLLDRELTKQIFRNNLKIGQKLQISGGKLNSSEPVTPLENENTKFQIGCNSTKRENWYSKLGFRKNFIFSRSISSVKPDGGIIPAIDVILLRKYPICYIEKYEEYSIIRNENDEYKEQQIFSKKLNEKLEKKKQEIIQKNSSISASSSLNLPLKNNLRNYTKNDVLKMNDGDSLLFAVKHSRNSSEFYKLLSPSQLNLLRFAKEDEERKKQQMISNEIQEYKSTDSSLTRNIKPITKILVRDCPGFEDFSQNKIEKASITIWNVNNEILNELKEGQRIRILFLDCSSYQISDPDAPIQLSCSNLQCLPIQQTSFQKKFYSPREFITNYNYFHNNCNSFHEFDCFGLLLLKSDPIRHFGPGKKPFFMQHLFFCDVNGFILVIHLRNATFPFSSSSNSKYLIYSMKNIIYEQKDPRYNLFVSNANEYSIFSCLNATTSSKLCDSSKSILDWAVSKFVLIYNILPFFFYFLLLLISSLFL